MFIFVRSEQPENSQFSGYSSSEALEFYPPHISLLSKLKYAL